MVDPDEINSTQAWCNLQLKVICSFKQGASMHSLQPQKRTLVLESTYIVLSYCVKSVYFTCQRFCPPVYTTSLLDVKWLSKQKNNLHSLAMNVSTKSWSKWNVPINLKAQHFVMSAYFKLSCSIYFFLNVHYYDAFASVADLSLFLLLPIYASRHNCAII